MSRSRYARQIILPEVGEKGQEAIRSSKVLCVGVGGLGAPAALYLASAGVGRIGLMDPDHVDVSNLQRQILYKTEEQGHSKAETAARALNDLNPEIEITPITKALSGANAEELFRQYDVILDGTDNFATKFLINDVAVKCGKPVVYGSLSRFEGQLSVFWAERGPCYRCLYPSPPRYSIASCAEAGVLGPLAGMIGSMQALQALQLILMNADARSSLRPLIGTLLVVDATGSEFRRLGISRRPNCPACSVDPSRLRIVSEDHSNGRTCDSSDTVSYDQMLQLQKSQGAMLVDVREESEWIEDHLPTAVHVPLSALESALESGRILALAANGANPSAPFILYCQSGIRSRRALELFRKMGFTNLKELQGGLSAAPSVSER